VTWRWSAIDHATRTHYEQRYGRSFIPPDMAVQDWPVSTRNWSRTHDRFERTAGVSARPEISAVRGRRAATSSKRRASADYPLPPLESSYGAGAFRHASRTLAIIPFNALRRTHSRAYTNPDGSKFGACVYCGYCERFRLRGERERQPHITVIPRFHGEQELRAAHPTRGSPRCSSISTKRRATGVVYTDVTTGEEYEQPASIVALCAYGIVSMPMP